MLEGMIEWVWDLEREMKSWELGGRPDLLLDDEGDELDDDSGPEHLCTLAKEMGGAVI